MIIKTNSFNFPFKLLALALILVGIISLINSHDYRSILLIFLGLMPFIKLKGLKLSDDKKSILIYAIYFFSIKSIKKRIEIPNDLDSILFLKKYFSVRNFTRRQLNYQVQSNYILFFVRTNAEKELIFEYIDYSEGFRIAKYLSEKLNCKLVEKKTYDDKIQKEDNETYDKTKRDRTLNLNMINDLNKE